ncbi:MAG: hypothetical protein WEA77_01755 [Hyphomonas sp.]|uniref:hypothetical protein n=1 Tax=Hyphomonas sp. TaxID=87 RepID=UPI00349FEF81
MTEEDGKRIVKRKVISARDMTPEQPEALGAEIEAKAAKLEARMAEREIAIGAHEKAIEHKMERLEKRIKMNSEGTERIMEERIGADFEAKVEAQAELIEYLVESWEDAKLNKGETRIIERADAQGEVFRLACVEGSRGNLKSGPALAAVGKYPGITEAGKAAFREADKGHKRKQVMVIRGDKSEAPEAPQPPLPPQAPLKRG